MYVFLFLYVPAIFSTPSPDHHRRPTTSHHHRDLREPHHLPHHSNHHHHNQHHQHHHHHRQSHVSTTSTQESMDQDSMANLVGSNHVPPPNHTNSNTMFRSNVDRGGAGGGNRWRSRSSPAVAHERWRHQSHGDLTFGHQQHRRDVSPGAPPPPPPRNFLHSSFHDLHTANEIRASRQDLRELRDQILRQNQAEEFNRQRSFRSSRRSLHERKWPPAPASPSCRRCSESAQPANMFRY